MQKKSGKIAAMNAYLRQHPRRLKPVVIILAGIAALALLAILVYQIPAVKNRLEWRLDAAMTYVQSRLDPAGALPTPNLATTQQVMPTVTATATLQVTATPIETPTPTVAPTALPAAVQLPSPAWEKEDWNACGPATLAMHLKMYGWSGDQFTVSSVIKPLREDRNVNIEELVYYVRTQVGWLNAEYRVGGDIDTLRLLLANGIPVMIEGTFMLTPDNPYLRYNDDRWAGHYILLTGYDDSAQKFITQDSELGADQMVTYSQLDADWQAFNRVYLVLFTADQQVLVQQLLGEEWDADTNRQNALDEALRETQSEPQNAFAWFNLGSNMAYFDRYPEAAQAYDQARTIGLPQRMLRYQFGPFMAYFNTARYDDLIALADYALKITANSEEAMLWKGWALYRKGDKPAALEQFQKALDAHPNYSDALYALDFVQNN